MEYTIITIKDKSKFIEERNICQEHVYSKKELY